MEQYNACAITGHRPTRFKFGYKEQYAGCKRLKKRLRDQFALLYQQGIRRFYVGGALGVDMWAGEILLRMKGQPEYQDIDLFITIPFEGHDAGWDERSRTRLAFLRRNCSGAIVVGMEGWRPEKSYRERNQYMVDHADVIVAVYDKDHSIRSGTGMTVNYAKKKGLHIFYIHPDTAVVSNE